ncbi:MAG: heme ABC exporter ATP-binding protein CcmA [Alphaproteobacteria bacterium]|nr:heme ABC exporter ATP-binding protein CcmA [Alphaproteobacteria bacterium]
MRLFAENLVVRRGSRIVIDELSFSADAGEALLLTGPNGSGKTTLLRAIAGFLTPEEGRVMLEGGAKDASPGEQSHYVGHANGIKSSLTAGENLRFWCDYLGAGTAREEKRERIDEALERLHLLALEDIPAGYLSAGQKRRLGLARLLVSARPLWLLDEPSVSLDTASVGLLAGMVKEHVASGGIAIAATHLPLGLENASELRLGAVRQEASV